MRTARWVNKKQIFEGFDWMEHAVCLWSEDECLRHDPSAERIGDAVVRLCGSMYDWPRFFRAEPDGSLLRVREQDPIKHFLGEAIDEMDGGDYTAKLYRSGWVISHSYEGFSLWRVVVDDKPGQP